MVVAGRTANELVVFAIIIVALVLFISEVIPNDVTTIGVIASLVVLEPWTGVDGRGAISGFANRSNFQ